MADTNHSALLRARQLRKLLAQNELQRVVTRLTAPERSAARADAGRQSVSVHRVGVLVAKTYLREDAIGARNVSDHVRPRRPEEEEK